ncbi:MAG: hypothetical protein IKN96_09425 [Oscillibacter sp.]|nr:hypothetical protein [Oscillibacter sp.]
MTTPKKLQSPPDAPRAAPLFSSSIVVEPAIPGQEYSIDGENWIKPDETGTVIFDNLTPGTEYSVIARREETDKQAPSAPSLPTRVITSTSSTTPATPPAYSPPSGGGGSSGGSGGSGGGGGTPKTYKVTVAKASNGKAKASPTRTESGLKITVTLSPDKGYAAADTIAVKADSGADVAVAKGADGSYTFQMPRSDVTVTPAFIELSDGDAPSQQDGTGNPVRA